MSSDILRTVMPASIRLCCLAALVSSAVGCGTVPRPLVEPPPTVSNNPSATTEARGQFTMAASMLDTWNAVGQVLVDLDGVTYESRAQMLGLYAVRYRGERLLILTRALVMSSQTPGMLTRVGAARVDGKSTDSKAAIELLGLLQQQLPGELARIAAGGGKRH